MLLRLKFSERTLGVGMATTFAFCATLFPMASTDIWWHLAAGRLMSQTHALIYEDPFSYAPSGMQWTNIHWFFQLVVYAIHSVCGIDGLILAKAATFSGSVLVLSLVLCRNSMAPISAAMLMLAAYTVRFFVLERPVVLAFLLFACFVLVLERLRTAVDTGFVWTLPVLQVIWVNTQGTFPLGVVTVLCYLLGWWVAARFRTGRVFAFEAPPDGVRLRLLLRVFGAVCAACLVSPYGVRALALSVALYSRIDPLYGGLYSLNVAEMAPMWVVAEEAPALAILFTAWGLAAIGLFVFNRRTLRAPHLLLFCVFLYLALAANRNLLFFVPVAAFTGTSNLGDLFGRVSFPAASARVRRIPWAVPGLVVLACGYGVAKGWAKEGCLGLAPFRHPVAAAELLEEGSFEGELFSSPRYGSYLIWRLWPRKKVFIDGRLALRSREFFAEYLRMLEEPERFRALQGRYGITRAVLPIDPSWGHLELIRFLASEPNWRIIYADEASVVLALDPEGRLRALELSSKADVDNVMGAIRRRYSARPAVLSEAKRKFAWLLVRLGHLERASEVLGEVSCPAPQVRAP